MADSHPAGQGVKLHQPFQLRQLPFAAPHGEALGADNRHTGGVIPPVFQPFQAIQNNGAAFLRTYVPDNATHILLTSS
jgi:hypothetical protein